MYSKVISLLILHFSFGFQEFDVDFDEFDNSPKWDIKRKLQISPEMVTNPPPTFFQGELVEEDDPRVAKQKHTENIKMIKLVHFLATTVAPHLIPRNWKIPLNGTKENVTNTDGGGKQNADDNQSFDNSANNFTSIPEEQPAAANDTQPEHAPEGPTE